MYPIKFFFFKIPLNYISCRLVFSLGIVQQTQSATKIRWRRSENLPKAKSPQVVFKSMLTPMDADLKRKMLFLNIFKHQQNWVVVSNIFYFHPYLGKTPILTNIFQVG